MIPLRVSGIIANSLFISFGYLEAVYPTLILHAILLPVNSVRLYQMLQLVKRVREAAQGDLDMNWLKPFMSSRHVRGGETLFRKGERANQMFFVVSGNYRLRGNPRSGCQAARGRLHADSGIRVLTTAPIGRNRCFVRAQAGRGRERGRGYTCRKGPRRGKVVRLLSRQRSRSWRSSSG